MAGPQAAMPVSRLSPRPGHLAPVPPPVEEAPPLALHEVRKRWPRTGQQVLDGVELVLAPGTVNLLSGSNGAGKTTLIRIVAGLVIPDGGCVEVFGLHPERDRAACHRRLGLLSAGDRGVFPRLTVRQHLRYWACVSLIPRNERGQAIADALVRFKLEELETRRLDRMSQGQRQRVRVAGAFLQSPDLLLLDEPANSLDDEGFAVLRDAVQRSTARGGAVLWCAPAADREPMEFDT